MKYKKNQKEIIITLFQNVLQKCCLIYISLLFTESKSYNEFKVVQDYINNGSGNHGGCLVD